MVKDLSEKVRALETQDAYAYTLIELASLRLRDGKRAESSASTEDKEAARELLDKAGRILDTFDSVEKTIHAAYYEVNAAYYKAIMEYNTYYSSSLLYLACIDLASLSPKAMHEQAYSLCLAALLGENIYNFGELLQHPVLDALKDTDQSWLRDLVFALNAGDISQFEGLAGHLHKDPLLESSQALLREKIHLAALVEAIFKRAPHDRTLSFSTIAHETWLPEEQVEFLIMKALSLGLIRGSIDQVDRMVRVTWVQPRVLNKQQIKNMRERLLEWTQSVSGLERFVEKAGREVWAQ
jgi:26S proteasome regulatory subunit N9